MSIQGDLITLASLEQEIKSLNKRAQTLRKQKKECEARIMAYIHSKELPGVKHGGVAVILEEKTARASKSKRQRDQDAKNVLERYGISDTDAVLKEILEARKGDAYAAEKIKTKKYK